MKLKCFFLLTLLIAGCYSPRMYNSKLRSDWPVKQFGGYAITGTGKWVGSGRFQLKNDSNIVGLIELPTLCYSSDYPPDSLNSTIQILPAGKTKKEDIQTIYLSNIYNIKIQNTGTLDSDEFKPFGGTLAMLIGEKNDFRLYCRYWKWLTSSDVNLALIASDAEMILTSNDKILAQFETGAKSSQRWYGYIAFINKRHGQHFTKQDFKAKGEKWMIDYILNKENERINNK